MVSDIDVLYSMKYQAGLILVQYQDEIVVSDILVGGWPTPLKNMKVNGKDYPIYYGK